MATSHQPSPSDEEGERKGREGNELGLPCTGDIV